VLKLAFTKETSTYSGKYYQLKDARFEPKPVQKPHPPILVGGMGPKLVQPLAARHANIWHFFVRDGDAAETRRLTEGFDGICRDVGRDPAEVTKSTSLRTPQLEGDMKAVRDRVRALVDAGVRDVVLSLSPPYDRAMLRRFAKEVVPDFL
jgi:alkanesulfonate monooxygenase SsuD/methylene tetrahydromethanopterin reductase-like flavin-dependent oxidoreductase (luciferase family)